ncbi:MAG: nicotinate phosphoribosyltransferase [Acidobacteria bacterium]|nr:nicotinate phosphoribosyltransferase [Acidobacteriota bacterium]
MKLNPLFPTIETLGINTDLYELTMSAVYFQSGHAGDWATFELFTRKLPPTRSFLVAAGLEQALHYITHVGFSSDTISYLRKLPVFSRTDPAFFDYLHRFRFSGDVHAVPEGTVLFENEPILQVSAPIIEAQVLETFLISTINFQTMVASKAARLRLAAHDKQVIDFGSRRAHTPQAGVQAARASFIGGCNGTSNVLAGYEMGIPVYGTMAHSFVQFFGDELESFRRFHDAFPDHSILLVDTYDSLQGVRKALQIGGKLAGVRLDSGDLLELAVKTRELLDQNHRKEARIVASGNLDEERVLSFSIADAPIDAYGVGTDLVVSRDAPTCDLVYKLVEVISGGNIQPRFKASEGKGTVPCRKQIFRQREGDFFKRDVVGRWDEDANGEPLLKKWVQRGRIIRELPSLVASKEYARQQLESLPGFLKLLHTTEVYPVEYSQKLLAIQRELEEQYA